MITKNDTGNTSEEPTGPRSTLLQEPQVQLKMSKLQVLRSTWETPIFKRFYLIPTCLSTTLFFSLCGAFGTWVGIVAFRLPNTAWVGIVGGVIAASLLIASTLFFSVLTTNLKKIMVRKRLWNWLNTKFDTWHEVMQWIVLTHPADLEFACTLEDDLWSPDQTNGGIILYSKAHQDKKGEDWDEEA